MPDKGGLVPASDLKPRLSRGPSGVKLQTRAHALRCSAPGWAEGLGLKHLDSNWDPSGAAQPHDTHHPPNQSAPQETNNNIHGQKASSSSRPVRLLLASFVPKPPPAPAFFFLRLALARWEGKRRRPKGGAYHLSVCLRPTPQPPPGTSKSASTPPTTETPWCTPPVQSEGRRSQQMSKASKDARGVSGSRQQGRGGGPMWAEK